MSWLRKPILGRPHLQLMALLGLIVPRRLRADWRQEWEAELGHRERLLADWDQLDWRHKRDLLFRSTSAFWDAFALQRKRLESEVFQDLRYGMRMVLTHPGFTALAVVLKLVVGQGMRLTIIGLAIGLGASFALTRLIEGLLFGVSPTDPLTFAAISLLLAAVAFGACWLPARRATRLNPVVALRYE